jgi:hypothetical protein
LGGGSLFSDDIVTDSSLLSFVNETGRVGGRGFTFGFSSLADSSGTNFDGRGLGLGVLSSVAGGGSVLLGGGGFGRLTDEDLSLLGAVPGGCGISDSLTGGADVFGGSPLGGGGLGLRTGSNDCSTEGWLVGVSVGGASLSSSVCWDSLTLAFGGGFGLFITSTFLLS